MNFNELNLSTNLLMQLSANNFLTPTEIQEKCLPVLMGGNDLIARSQTGSGKTLAYILPIIHALQDEANGVQALVLCPTRELAEQVTTEFKKIIGEEFELKVLPVCGGSDMVRQIKAIRNRTNIIVGTTGRVVDHINRKSLKLNNIKFVVLDEADEMLKMGFYEDIEFILSSCPKIRQTAMFSATFPDGVKMLSKKFLTNPITIEIGDNNRAVSSVKQYFIYSKKKDETLLSFIKTFSSEKTIIFSNTKLKTNAIKNLLNFHGIECSILHGDLAQRERNAEIKKFKENTTNILVATDVASRGLDIDDVQYVINYDFPSEVEYYIHRIGRTARIGKNGTAITIINTKNQNMLIKSLEKNINARIVEIRIDNDKISEVEYKEINPKKIIEKSKKFDKYNKNTQKNDKKPIKTAKNTNNYRKFNKYLDNNENKKSYSNDEKPRNFSKKSTNTFKKSTDFGAKKSYNKSESSAKKTYDFKDKKSFKKNEFKKSYVKSETDTNKKFVKNRTNNSKNKSYSKGKFSSK